MNPPVLPPLTRRELVPIAAAVGAAGLYTLRWYIGDMLPPQLAGVYNWLAIVGGVAAVVSLEGVLVSTVMSIRQHGPSRWGYAAIAVTASFSALVALDLYGAFGAQTVAVPPFAPTETSSGTAWLHAAFALSLVCYLMHLAQPSAIGQRLRTLNAALSEANRLAEDSQRKYDDERARLMGDLVTLRGELAQAQQVRSAAPELSDGSDRLLDMAVALRKRGESLRSIARISGIHESTLRYQLRNRAQDEEGEE